MASQGPTELPGTSGCLASPGEGKECPGTGGSWSHNPPDTAGQTHRDPEDRSHWGQRRKETQRETDGARASYLQPLFSREQPPGSRPWPSCPCGLTQAVWGDLRACVQPPSCGPCLVGTGPKFLGAGRMRTKPPQQGVEDGVGEGPSAQRQVCPHAGSKGWGALSSGDCS